MKTRCLRSILALLMLLTAGCGRVITESPVGDIAQIDPADWEGTWTLRSGEVVHTFNVTVTDADNGVIRATTPDYKNEDGQPVVWSAELYLRRSASFAEYWLVSVKASDLHQVASELLSGYYWGIARRDQGQIIGWAPNGNTFRVLMERGALRGEAIHDMGWNVHLSEFGTEQLKLVSAEDGLLSNADEPKLSLFMWQLPVVFIRQ